MANRVVSARCFGRRPSETGERSFCSLHVRATDRADVRCPIARVNDDDDDDRRTGAQICTLSRLKNILSCRPPVRRSPVAFPRGNMRGVRVNTSAITLLPFQQTKPTRARATDGRAVARAFRRRRRRAICDIEREDGREDCVIKLNSLSCLRPTDRHHIAMSTGPVRRTTRSGRDAPMRCLYYFNAIKYSIYAIDVCSPGAKWELMQTERVSHGNAGGAGVRALCEPQIFCMQMCRSAHKRTRRPAPMRTRCEAAAAVINRVRKGCAEEMVLFLHVICQLHIDGSVFDET